MKHDMVVLSAAAAMAFAALSPAFGQENLQLAAGARLTPAEAAGLSLTEIAMLKFNRDSGDRETNIVISRRDDVAIDPVAHSQLIQSARLDADAARGMSLVGAFGYKIDRDNTDDNRMIPPGGREAIPVDPVAHAQLIAAAGLTPSEAQGLTLGELGERKARADSGW